MITYTIYYNKVTKNITAGNITTSISGHLNQFLFIHNRHSDTATCKLKQMKYFNKIGKKVFKDELSQVNWEEYLQIARGNTDLLFDLLFEKLEYLYQKHCPEKLH